ncbi:MAG: ATP-binding cassette domain-containing protein [Bacilli bacterium]|nr:ATP-binding cassette domain-containing protein [Bacilli bacterium]
MARKVTYLPELVENNIELSVRHLKQFFKFGHGKSKFITKAVHNVSFDIKKGECFGVVGESGCGKTTTGRTLIRLYKATSGSVYFKGYRIVAGNRWNEKEIKWKRIKARRRIKELQNEMNEKVHSLTDEQGNADFIASETAKIKAEYDQQIKKIESDLAELIKEQKEKIAQHNYDNRHVDKKLMSKMQMIFQDPVDSLDPRMTVEDIIQEGLHIQGQYNRFENSQKVKDALIKVGLLPEYASRYPHEFSGGQRQRIGIARALIMNPDFLICDEPISALDVSIRAQIINLLNNLKDEMGLTIMFIAHDLSVVKYFCDRIAVMYFGNIVEMASSDELFKHPLHPYTRALLSAIPKPDPLSEKVRKRYVYKPQEEHDYSKEAPSLVEVIPGHFVMANTEELEKYRKQINENK